MAARVGLLLVLCVLPALVAAIRPQKNPFSVEGRVYCDTCRAGFETSATTYIPGTLSRLILFILYFLLIFPFFFFSHFKSIFENTFPGIIRLVSDLYGKVL